MVDSQEMAETDSSQPASRIDTKRLITIGEITPVSKYESSTPTAVTDQLLEGQEELRDIPTLGSSLIEDFIIAQIRAGITDPEPIAAAFVSEKVVGNVLVHAETIRKAAENIDWGKTFTLADARDVQTRIATQMRDMGMTPEQITPVATMRIDITEGMGVSSLSETEIYIARLQAVRKALDYQRVYGTSIPLNVIIRSLMTNTVGHELGHKVDSVASMASNTIPSDENWKKDEECGENKSERFAEFWGRLATEGGIEMKQIAQKERLIQVAKVAQLWNTLAKHNETHESKADLMGIFEAIDKKIGKADAVTTSLFSARRLFYADIQSENFAAPFPRDVVIQAVNPTQAEL